MMNIKPVAAIRKNYNEVSKLCKRTGEPVYLTKNGGGAGGRRGKPLGRREWLFHQPGVRHDEGRCPGSAEWTARIKAML